MEIKYSGPQFDGNRIKLRKEEMAKWHDLLVSSDYDHPGAEFKGWAVLPSSSDKELIEAIKQTAEEIRKKCSLFVVIGIGGSFLGAKAVIDALNGSQEGFPEVVFAGYNMNGAYLNKVKKRMAKESSCLCVISKSGRTVEPLLAYAILKDLMFAKYGYREARKRIFVITDEKNGDLRPDAFENRFRSFVIPDNIGGRYSVLTPVGLLPTAVAGHDIEALVNGALKIETSDWSADGSLLDYAVNRTILQEENKVLEIFEYFEGNLRYFGEWLKQLFGETEGKEGRGAYPVCQFFSRDLHSLGQFLQQGNQIFYETMIRISDSPDDIEIPWYAGYPYAGKTLEQINDCAEQGVIKAHQNAGIPINEIHIDRPDEDSIGQMIYFFEMSAALSAYSMGLNPFDQPGVEEYKKEMHRLVTKL